MEIQILPTLLLYSILIASLIFFIEGNEQFFNCSSPFSCGGNVQNIRYPFWAGDDSPLQECGLQGFKLKCLNNDYSTIDINNQTFRVLKVNTTIRALRIARNDLWGNLCLGKYENTTTLNVSTFRYSPDFEMFNLFYDCPEHNLPLHTKFACENNETGRFNYLRNESFPSVEIRNCASNISVPVLKTAVDEFKRNETTTLEEVISQGFNVEYRLDNVACFACVIPGGSCLNSPQQQQPTNCLCHNRNQQFECHLPIRKSNLTYTQKLALAIGTAVFTAFGIGILALIVSLRRKWSICLIKTDEYQNMEAILRNNGSLAPKRYHYSDVKKMTNSFKIKLGQGGYGSVYKGTTRDDHLVAVKILNELKENGEEFINEVASISRTSHVNIVKLIGFCFERKKRALIYEFMPNGSLEKFIYDEKSLIDRQLGWRTLYKISVGIARGLEYLHSGCNTQILHFDIKPHNILLSEDFIPKISDFGLSKLSTTGKSVVSMLGARGTIGYIAPEIVCRTVGGVSHKSDVYSYGMMILEMVGGRKNVDVGVDHTSEIYYPHWIYKQLKLNQELGLDGILDAEENEKARKMIIVSLWCIQTVPSTRPSMSKVVEMLEGSLKSLQIPPKPYLYSSSRSANESSSIQIP